MLNQWHGTMIRRDILFLWRHLLFSSSYPGRGVGLSRRFLKHAPFSKNPIFYEFLVAGFSSFLRSPKSIYSERCNFTLPSLFLSLWDYLWLAEASQQTWLQSVRQSGWRSPLIVSIVL
jgi:hypothetical protein